MKNIEDVEGQNEENIDNERLNEELSAKEVLLGNKRLISKNKKVDRLINEYNEKNKKRRHFFQKKPINS